MERILITVYGKAEPAGSKDAWHKGGKTWVSDANPKSKPWKNMVAQAAGEQYGGPLLDGPVGVEMWFYRPRPGGHWGTGRNSAVLKPSAPPYPTSAPDALKLARAVEDALSGVVYRDDAQIVDEVLHKRYGEPARVEIALWRVVEAPRPETQLALVS